MTRTCLERGCVRSFHERQKQTESEMKGLILIRLESQLHAYIRVLKNRKFYLIIIKNNHHNKEEL